MNFFDKLLTSIEQNQSLLYLDLDPNAESLPKEAERLKIFQQNLYSFNLQKKIIKN